MGLVGMYLLWLGAAYGTMKANTRVTGRARVTMMLGIILGE